MPISKMIAEAIGTFALVFAGCGAIMVSERVTEIQSIPVVFGLVIAVMIYAVGHISGAHFNPAVTAAFAVIKKFPKEQVFYYWLAQFSGALIASTTLYFILPSGIEYGATLPEVNLISAVVWEIIMTFFLMFVITAVATDSRAEGVMAGAAIGGVVMLCAFLGGPITGASLNPARSFAPALFQGSLDTIWIYFLGPFLGASLGALTYEKIRCDNSNNNSSTTTEGCC